MNKVKKIVLMVMMLCGIFSCISQASEGEKIVTSGNFQYEITDWDQEKEALILKYIGNEKVVTLPATIDGMKALYGDYTNYIISGNKTVEKVIYEEGIERISVDNIVDCPSLKEIVLPKTVNGWDANDEYGCIAQNCPKLEKITVNQANKVFCSIDGVLFTKSGILVRYPENRKGSSYRVPKTVTTLSDSAFSESKLKKITLPENLKVISDGVFYHCENLKSIVVPKGVKYMCEEYFASEQNLGKKAFVICGYKYSKAYQCCKRNNYTFKAIKIPAPKKLKVTKSKKAAKLTWKKVGSATGYEVYRATAKNGTYKKLKTLKKNTLTSYQDKKVKTGKTYYYKVKSIVTNSYFTKPAKSGDSSVKKFKK